MPPTASNPPPNSRTSQSTSSSGIPASSKRPDRADDGLVARIEPTVRERTDLADRHQPFDQGDRRAGFLGELGERHGAHAAMVRGRYPVEHGTGDRHETEANDLTELAARPAIPPGLLIGGVVAIGRHVAAAAVPAVAEALAGGGVRAFELTLNEPEDDALAVDRGGRAPRPRDLGLEIGAGTVLTIEAAHRAIDAGATFLVMPHLDDGPRGLGGRPRHPGIPRVRDADRGPRRLAGGRGRGQALPRVVRRTRASCARCAARSPTSRSCRPAA